MHKLAQSTTNLCENCLHYLRLKLLLCNELLQYYKTDYLLNDQKNIILTSELTIQS